MKIGVVIPTIAGREHFLARCKYYLSNQYLQPDHIEIVEYDKKIEGPDTTYRYVDGFTSAFKKHGCDVVLCIEDDDYYSPDYILSMIIAWQHAGEPDLLGIDYSFYYHIVEKRYSKFLHPNRSSMMAMLVSKNILTVLPNIDKDDQYLDLQLWNMSHKILTRATISPIKAICIGIKHGFGQVAGGGHQSYWPRYKHFDPTYKWLDMQMGQDSVFYKMMAAKSNYTISASSNTENPFLSIVTRCHGARRPEGFRRNEQSVDSLKNKSWEHILIIDQKGAGVYYANMSFVLAIQAVKGEYVFMLDDDDFINNPDMIDELMKDTESKPDIVLFKMEIKNGNFNNIYPSPECWQSRKPKIAHIGTSCFAVRRDIWAKYIHHFGHPRCGDYRFLEAIWNGENNLKSIWLDVLMSETGGKPSHGKTEI